MSYQLVKLIHILAATVLIGTGAGSAFYLFISYKKASFTTLKEVLGFVVLADMIFIAPAVVVQGLTGLWMADTLSLMYSTWFWVVIGMCVLVLVTWLPAAYIQIKLKKMIADKDERPPEFDRLIKIWAGLGVPSFGGAMYIYYLMLFKPFI